MITNLLKAPKAFYTKVFSLVFPIMLQNGITTFVSLIDNLMVGAVGTEQMSAVAIVNQIIYVFNLAVFGIISGVGIFTAQYFGKGDTEGIKNTFRLKLVCVIILLFCALLLFSFKGSVLINSFLHDSGSDMNLTLAFDEAKKYLLIISISLIPFIISQVYASTLRETERPIIPLIAGTFAVIINIFFNYLLIFGKAGFPRLGVTGAAISTVISRLSECAVIIILTHFRKKAFDFTKGLYRNFTIPKKTTLRILPKALPLLANDGCWAYGVAVINFCYSIRGLEVVAAANITSTISNLFSVCTIAFGNAISIIVGGMLGAGETDKAKKTNTRLTLIAFMFNTALGIILIFLSDLFPNLYNTQNSVKQLATIFILCYAVYLPFNALTNCFYFALRSGGKTYLTFIFDTVFIFLISIPFTYFLAKHTDFSVIVVYATSLSVEVFKAILGYILIKKSKWAQNLVKDV